MAEFSQLLTATVALPAVKVVMLQAKVVAITLGQTLSEWILLEEMVFHLIQA